MRRLQLALAALIAVQALTIAGCSQPSSTLLKPEPRSPEVNSRLKDEPLIEPEVREAIEAEIPSVTYVAHYMAPLMYGGPDGDFGAHQVTVVSSSPQIDDEQLLRALLALDGVWNDTSAIDLMVIFPAADGTGIARRYEWPRPLRWIKHWEGRSAVPAADSLEEGGLVATADNVDREMIENAVEGIGEIPWDTKPRPSRLAEPSE